jgi:hypothetical protein
MWTSFAMNVQLHLRGKENGDIVEYGVLVLRIQEIWLFSQQGRCVAVQVPHDPRGGIVIYCRCSFVILKHSVVSMLEFDGTGFVTDVVYDHSSLPRDR